jgi:hypothetical protein
VTSRLGMGKTITFFYSVLTVLTVGNLGHNSSRLESDEERCGRAQEQLRGMLAGGEAAGRARWAALEQGPLARHAETLDHLHQREPKIN